MSGDMNTGLGNCVLMCGMFWSWFQTAGLEKFELMNNGDDCVVIIEQDDLPRLTSGITQFFRELGFTLVLEEPVFEFEKISFCQTQPVFDGVQYIMVRDPRVCIAKDVRCMIPLTQPTEVRAWMEAVGTGGLALTGGIPILQEFYQCLIRHSEGRKAKLQVDIGWSLRHLAMGLNRGYQRVSPEARVSFWLAFGIQPSEQEALEEYYRTVSFSVLAGSDLPLSPDLLLL